MAELKRVRSGSRGPFVELLQLALRRSGYLTSEIDGIFGQRTLEALRRFQSYRGLAPDGIAGPVTWRALMPFLTGYLRHTVRSGDTFYALSRLYGTGVGAIETANPNLDPMELRPGMNITVPLGFEVVSTEVRFTPTYLELCAAGLSARYPFLRRGSAGRSVMGRELITFELGSGANQVFFNASHHANEWITSPLLMKYLENYCRAYASGGTIYGRSAEGLYALTTLYMIPMVNPDGVALVTGELTSGSFYTRAVGIAANYPSIPFTDGWKANINGVDPNLQYPAGWSEAREIKFAQGYVSPAPRDYVGAAPLEIPESRAVYNYTRAHDFSLTLSYHTQGRVIYWKYADYMPPNSYNIGLNFASVSGYTLSITPAASANAGYKDWFISSYNRPGYTIEAGSGTAPLPLEQFPTIYAENEGIMTLALTATIG